MTDTTALSITELQQKAQEGDAQAQLDLAYRLAIGEGIERNIELAFQWLIQSAELGNADAQFTYGISFIYESLHQPEDMLGDYWVTYLFIGVPIDHFTKLSPCLMARLYFIAHNYEKKCIDAKHALLWIEKAAEQNHAEAQYYMFFFYEQGIGVSINYELAVEWLKKSAESGFVRAQSLLGDFYEAGERVEKNMPSAVELFKKVAIGGDDNAQYKLACCYLNADGVEQNYGLALDWLKQAANHLNDKAVALLARCYTHGIGVEKNEDLAYEWHMKAADVCNIGESQHWIARYYLFGGKLNHLCDWEKKSLEGDNDGSGIPGYWRNEFLAQGCSYAFSWATKSANNGYPEAYLLLGFMNAYGIGTEQNHEEAFECFKKAVELGHEGIADYFLGGYYAQGVYVAQNTKLADSHYKKSDIQKVFEYYDIERLLKNTDHSIQNRLIKLDRDLNITVKNQELEAKNEKLEKAQRELEEMMAMFAHKFRSPLDTIIYNATHENQAKRYTQTAQTMSGLLDVFIAISTDSERLKERIKQDNQGQGRLLTLFLKTLDMLMLHLLSPTGAKKIRQHYLAYAKVLGQCAPDLSYKAWREGFYELEQQMQAEWEQGYAQLLNQSESLEPRLAWVEQHFFKLELPGFDNEEIQFEPNEFKESFLMILLNEILVNAFKYYSSETKQPVVLEWHERDGYQVLSCRNPSVRSERSIIKGSGKGHVFLSTLARKTGSQFIKPKLQDDFVLEFGIPNDLLLAR